MTSQYPWMFALDHDDRARCAQDLIDAARSSFFTSQPHLAIAKLTSWRETAEAIAAGLGEEVVEWLDSDDEDGATFIVERPRAVGRHTSVPQPTKKSEYTLRSGSSSAMKRFRSSGSASSG